MAGLRSRGVLLVVQCGGVDLDQPGRERVFRRVLSHRHAISTRHDIARRIRRRVYDDELRDSSWRSLAVCQRVAHRDASLATRRRRTDHLCVRSVISVRRARSTACDCLRGLVAAVFRLPRLAPLTYYLTTSVNDLYALMGLTSSTPFSGIGGVSQPVNHQLFSGSAILGEEYRHELVHFLFATLCCDGRRIWSRRARRRG